MRYLEELRARIDSGDFPKFMQIWEEYVHGDKIDVEEFKQILKAIKTSDFSKPFGKYVESALPLLKLIDDQQAAFEILRLLIDLQNSNTPQLADIAYKALEAKYGQDPLFKEKLKLVGLRTRDNFQGAISSYELLTHMKKENFVFHAGGWGVGEIIDVSTVREQIVVEFENVNGRKDISYENAFKTLIPLADDHFLARRFGNADALEAEARDNPLEAIRLLLRDLGPKTASEIKDELCEVVIPEKEWTKWWQGARAKLKKDTFIESPTNLKDSFRLRTSEMTHEDRMKNEMHGKTDLIEIIQTSYNYVRDFPNMLKKEEVKTSIKEKLLSLMDHPNLSSDLELQILIFFETLLNEKVPGKSIEDMIKKQTNIEDVVDAIEIIAFKKRAMQFIKQYRPDWQNIFLNLLFNIDQSALKEFLVKELNQGESAPLLKKKLVELIKDPALSPEMYVWYFQEILEDEKLPFGNSEGRGEALDGLLILLNKIEPSPRYRDLVKKVMNIISGKRYAVVRQIIEDKDIEFIKEFLLLASKCHSFGDHDLKILRSLAEVVQPSLAKAKKSSKNDINTVWTTEEGLLKTQERIKHIGTVEIVENAREIEVARSYGDLRENSEYKFALERRSRLQGELKMLSDLLKQARVITKDDIPVDEVGVGSIVDLKDGKGNSLTYTILGPWDANSDSNVLSFQSKLAQAMTGNKKGDTFKFRDDEFTILDIRSYL
jgi:transcription elongation factor GreA-like protein/transcription elongation GreA/GreB family factor